MKVDVATSQRASTCEFYMRSRAARVAGGISLLKATSGTYIPCVLMKECGSDAHLAVSQLTSMSKSTSPLLVVEATLRPPANSMTTALGATRPSVLGSLLDLPLLVSGGEVRGRAHLLENSTCCSWLVAALSGPKW